VAEDGRFHIGELDISARAGFLLGAVITGMSFQPNLLSRGTRDQAVVTGVAAAAVLAGLLVSSNLGQRLPGSTVTGAIQQTGPEAQLAQAQQDLSNGKYLDAVKTYDAILNRDPRNPERSARNPVPVPPRTSPRAGVHRERLPPHSIRRPRHSG